MKSEATKVIFEKYKGFFDLTARLLEKGSSTISGEHVNTHALSTHIAVLHLARATDLLRGIDLLCRAGQSREAMILLRSLLNLLINIKWLSAGNSAERMTRYADFEVVFWKQYLDLAKKQNIGKPSEIDYSKHDDAFAEVVRKYSLNPKNNHKLNQWSGESISKMAEEVGLAADYHHVYSYLSALEHTGPIHAKKYLEYTNGNIVAKMAPSDENVPLVLWSALGYYLAVLEAITRIPGLNANLEDENRELNELYKKYFSR